MAGDERCCSGKYGLKSLKAIDDDARNKAEFFKAISDPARVKIVYALANGEFCVCELVEIMGMPQTVVSHHLKILKYARIVSDRKSGKWVIYSLADDRALEALKVIDKAPEK